MSPSEKIKKYIQFLNTLKLDYSTKLEEFGYDNPVTLLLDATLSINRQYNNFVVPRLTHFAKNYPNINTLQKLDKLITRYGIDGFKEVWNYNHPQRVEILKDLTEFFLKNKVECNLQDDIESMRHWAKLVDVETKKIIPVNGIGFATGQYIRKLLGIDTVKPDVHIKKSISEGLEETMSGKKTVVFLENVAKAMNTTPTELDHAIWKYYSLK